MVIIHSFQVPCVASPRGLPEVLESLAVHKDEPWRNFLGFTFFKMKTPETMVSANKLWLPQLKLLVSTCLFGEYTEAQWMLPRQNSRTTVSLESTEDSQPSASGDGSQLLSPTRAAKNPSRPKTKAARLGRVAHVALVV